eukprot:COSAG06_NODE_40604_length_400_cov_0.863787_2_plen_44_part_01
MEKAALKAAVVADAWEWATAMSAAIARKLEPALVVAERERFESG